MDDWALLQDYVRNGSEEAFARIVERHTDMVYAFCFRQVRNRELAEEAAQTVFIVLARKAATLRRDTVLSGWLFKTARFAIANALKIEARKRRIQMRAQAMASVLQSREPLRAANDDAFALLDDAMAQLRDFERNAVLLKYFEQRTLAEVGTALGVSTDAAEKRISRAIDKLHAYFAQRGIVLSLAGMGSLLSAAASQMAPQGFAASLAKTVAVKSLKGTAPAAGQALVESTLRAMAWARWKPAFATACMLLFAFAAIFVARAGANSDLTARSGITSVPAQPIPSAETAVANNNKMDAELLRLCNALLGSDAGRDEAERQLEAFVQRAGQPAFTAFLQFAKTPAVKADTDAVARAAKIRQHLTEPVFLWGQVTGMTLSHAPRPAASATLLAQGTDDGLFVLDPEGGAILWNKLNRAAPSSGCISETTLFNAVPFNPNAPHVTLAGFGNDGTALWSHAFDALYPFDGVAQLRTSLALDAQTKRIFITAGADEKEVLSAFNDAGAPIWSIHCGTLCGTPVLAPDLKFALVGCEMANGANAEIHAVHLADGSPAWVASLTGLHRNCVAEANARVYAAVAADGQEAAFSQASHLASRDANNGSAVWDCDVNDALPAAKTRATLEYLAQSKFSEHSWHEPGGSDRDIVGVPIVAANHQRVISQTKRFLFGLDTASGKLLWSAPCLRIEETRFAARNDVVFAGSDDGQLLAVRALDGRVVWTLDLNQHPAAKQAPRVFEIRDNDFPHGSNRIGAVGEPTVVGDVLYTTTSSGWTSAWRLPNFELPADQQ